SDPDGFRHSTASEQVPEQELARRPEPDSELLPFVQVWHSRKLLPRKHLVGSKGKAELHYYLELSCPDLILSGLLSSYPYYAQSAIRGQFEVVAAGFVI